MINVQELPINKQFSRRLVKPDTWILNGFLENRAQPHPHVVIGEKYAIVIDTTDQPFNVRKYVEEIVTDKPLMVASTHSHGDHTYNNYQFDDCPIYMSEVAWEEIQQSRANNDNPNAHWKALGNYVPILVKEGDIIDLGGRELECIKFCGTHSPSSIMYLDRKYGVLFTGDEFECGQVLVGGARGNNCVELYRENLLHLKEVGGDRIKAICPPHNGSPIDPLFIDYMIENCERIMAGHEGEKDTASMSYLLNPSEGRPAEMAAKARFNPDSRRSEWKGTSLVYNIHRILFKDIV